ncbi:MAG: TlpA family protein disulfide reductase [Saprospiraceae bacterium]|nr:TlpA family protein disulfide reductase [Saprospiraceae bacterium]
MADKVTAAMGLAFTFLSAYFLQRQYGFSLSKVDKCIVALFPLIFLIGLYNSLIDFGYFRFKMYNFSAIFQTVFYLQIINPGLIAFITLVLGLTWLKDLRNPANVFVFSFITLFYSYLFMYEWKLRWHDGKRINFDTEAQASNSVIKTNDQELNHNINLANFAFINATLDTVSLLDNADKYILLETWAETCAPCRKAMLEMPSFYQSVADKLSVFYVYENRKASVRDNFEQIFSFKEIKDTSRIVIDIEQELYHALGMQGYPYFLLFDAKGNLILHIQGYGNKDNIAARIAVHLK